jgi:hypothetical protein
VKGFFQGRVSRTACLRLPSNNDPPDRYLLSSWDYRREPLAWWAVPFDRAPG